VEIEILISGTFVSAGTLSSMVIPGLLITGKRDCSPDRCFCQSLSCSSNPGYPGSDYVYSEIAGMKSDA
jgi:hypothetical protein